MDSSISEFGKMSSGESIGQKEIIPFDPIIFLYGEKCP